MTAARPVHILTPASLTFSIPRFLASFRLTFPICKVGMIPSSAQGCGEDYLRAGFPFGLWWIRDRYKEMEVLWRLSWKGPVLWVVFQGTRKTHSQDGPLRFWHCTVTSGNAGFVEAQ